MRMSPYPASAPPPLLTRQAGGLALAQDDQDAGDFAHEDLQRLARASLQSHEAALQQVQDWHGAGHDLEDLYIHAIAPCARLLGDWWRLDELDFAQVTIASSNLQRVLNTLSPVFCAPGADRPTGLSLLLATEPQAQHTMGAFMLAEFFRRRGWGVQLLVPLDGEEVLGHLRRDWYDAIGLSVSTGRQLEALKALLPRLRAESPNPQLNVLVGGPLALNQPEALESLGVDLLGGDARRTVELLRHMVGARQR